MYSIMLCTQYNSALTTSIVGCIKVRPNAAASIRQCRCVRWPLSATPAEYPCDLHRDDVRRRLHIHLDQLRRSEHQVRHTLFKPCRWFCFVWGTDFVPSVSHSIAGSLVYSYITFTQEQTSKSASNHKRFTLMHKLNGLQVICNFIKFNRKGVNHGVPSRHTRAANVHKTSSFKLFECMCIRCISSACFSCNQAE